MHEGSVAELFKEAAGPPQGKKSVMAWAEVKSSVSPALHPMVRPSGKVSSKFAWR